MLISTQLYYGVYLGTAKQVQNKYKASQGMVVDDHDDDTPAFVGTFEGVRLICQDGMGLLCVSNNSRKETTHNKSQVVGLNLLTPSKLDEIQVQLNDVANTLMATNLNRVCQVFSIVSSIDLR